MKFKYIAISTVVFLFLFLPFAIKTIDMRLEIFPSVILPSSSGTIKIDKNKIVGKVELYGIVQNGDTLELDKGEFMKPMPKHYLDRLLDNNFGLKEFKIEQAKTNKFGLPFKIKSKVTKAEISETKGWLRNRLKTLGCLDTVLIVKQRRIVISPEMSILESSLENDTIYKLY